MTSPLGIAVIGLGIGEQHARMYATLPSCAVRLVVDLDRSRAERLATEFPGAEASDGIDDAFERRDVDVISIASFDDAHFGQVIRALSSGKHVFVEKEGRILKSDVGFRDNDHLLQIIDQIVSRVGRPNTCDRELMV